MTKLIRLMMLICIFATFNCYISYSEEIDDKIQKIILNIPEVASDISLWTNKYKNQVKDEEYKEFMLMEKQKINLDGNNLPDFIVIANYLQLGGVDGGSRSILAIIKDMNAVVFTDFYQYFTGMEVIDNIIPNVQSLFYRSLYSHGFLDGQSKLVGLWPKPEILLNMNFSSYVSTIGSTDEDNFRFVDLDGDGLKEICLKHINLKYVETPEDDVQPVLSSKEIKVFKYDASKRQLVELIKQELIKNVRDMYNKEN